MSKKWTILFFAFVLVIQAKADSLQIPASITVSGYLEPYFSYDFAEPENHIRQPFLYSYNRHNEVNLNLGLVKLGYQKDKVRGNFGLMAGTYSNDNLAAEQGVMRNVYEANVGVKIGSKRNTWIDAGVFSSHIGFESAIGKDCWNLTRSLLADNSPYYESGVKLSHTSENGKWYLGFLVLNGWQRISRPVGQNNPCFGHQITFTPNKKITINSSSFIGSDKPDSSHQMRYFHNFYAILKLNDHLGFIAGFDIGAEEKLHSNSKYNLWYSPVVIARYAMDEKHMVAARAEYYHDDAGVIINTGQNARFMSWGYSINFDYAIEENILWRIEARTFVGEDAIFVLDNQSAKENYFLTSSFCLSF